MARVTAAERALDRDFDRAFGRLGSGVQFDVFDLGKLRADALAAMRGGAAADEAVGAAVARYRKN